MKSKNDVPLFSSWKAWYAFVIGFLVLLIGFFVWFTGRYS